MSKSGKEKHRNLQGRKQRREGKGQNSWKGIRMEGNRKARNPVHEEKIETV